MTDHDASLFTIVPLAALADPRPDEVRHGAEDAVMLRVKLA